MTQLSNPTSYSTLNVRAGVPIIVAGQNGLQQPGAGRGQRGAHRLLQHAKPAPGAAAANQCDHANRQEANGHDQRQNERDDDNEDVVPTAQSG